MASYIDAPPMMKNRFNCLSISFVMVPSVSRDSAESISCSMTDGEFSLTGSL